jgi:hypothetical protein
MLVSQFEISPANDTSGGKQESVPSTATMHSVESIRSLFAFRTSGHQTFSTVVLLVAIRVTTVLNPS